MLFRLLPVPLCYVAVHVNGLQGHKPPVASKPLTQKRPVSAAPERLVGDFFFLFGNQVT